MRIITSNRRASILIESILDRLFYRGSKRAVAKLILTGDPEVKKGIAPKSLISQFPREFSIARASSFKTFVGNVRELLMDFIDDDDNIQELAANAGCSPEEASETCQHLLN